MRTANAKIHTFGTFKGACSFPEGGTCHAPTQLVLGCLGCLFLEGWNLTSGWVNMTPTDIHQQSNTPPHLYVTTSGPKREATAKTVFHWPKPEKKRRKRGRRKKTETTNGGGGENNNNKKKTNLRAAWPSRTPSRPAPRFPAREEWNWGHHEPRSTHASGPSLGEVEAPRGRSPRMDGRAGGGGGSGVQKGEKKVLVP